jgi:hypothetical protein
VCARRRDALRALIVQARAASLLSGGPVPPVEAAPLSFAPWI